MTSGREAIAKAMSFLGSVQCEDGSFPSYVRSDDGNEGPSPNAFCTYLIASALRAALADSTEESPSIALRRGILAFVQGESRDNGAFNYWKSSARESMPPYPDDLDDTALAYAARLSCGDMVSGKDIAALARLLPAAEIDEGGPYATWIVEGAARPVHTGYSDAGEPALWSDVDPGVNANVAYLLSQLGIRLPKLDAYLERALRARSYSSAYYPDPLAVSYFITRGYSGSALSEAVPGILRYAHPDGTYGSPLHNALAVASLARAGAPQEAYEAARYALIEAQHPDGGFASGPLYLEQSTKAARRHAGGRAVTTAIAIDALSCAAAGQHATAQGRGSVTSLSLRVVDSYAGIRSACRSLAPSCEVILERYFAAFAGDDFWRGVMEIPLVIARALSIPGDASLVSTVVDAHLSGLIGYSLLDAIADGEQEARYAPCASFLIRRCAGGYRAAGSALESILSGIEAAVLREADMRLPRDADGFDLSGLAEPGQTSALSEKSLGVALPALALLDVSGAGDAEAGACRAFFGALLSARQWNDDAHDIRDDLARGHVTPAGWEALVRFAARRPGARFDPDRDGHELHVIFWYEVFPIVCDAIGEACMRARAALGGLAFRNEAYFSECIGIQERLLERSLREHSDALAFIASYQLSALGRSSPGLKRDSSPMRG